MSVIYKTELRVDSRDVDLFNQARPSAVLGIMQEAATQAAIDLKADGPRIREKYGCIWMVTRNWVELEAPLRWNDRIVVETWHRGGTGASVYRDFDFFRDGKYVGQAVSIWVMADIESRKLFRMRDAGEFQDTDGGGRSKAVRLHKVKLPEVMDAAAPRYLGYSDTDINGHVNNIHYADYACDALHLERESRDRFVRSFQIGYVSECRAGETIRVETAARGDERFARGEGAGGEERFDFSLELGAL